MGDLSYGRAAGRALAARAALPALVAALACVPLVTNEYTQYIVNLMLVYTLVTLGFNIVVGYLGQLAFANAAFFGIGAYTTAVLMTHLGVPFWLTLVPAGLIGALAGILTSVPALRGIRLFYLAIATIAFSELMRWLYIHADALTYGSTGIAVPPASVFGISVDSQQAKHYLFLVLNVIIIWGTVNLLKSRIGRAIVAIRENELAAASLAIPTSWYFVLAFAWSGFIVGIAGAMFAILIGRVVPESFNLIQLIIHFALVMVGGIGSVIGSLLGAVVLTSQPELFRGFPGLDEVFFSLTLILVLVFLPRGLVSLLERWVPGLAEHLYRE